MNSWKLEESTKMSKEELIKTITDYCNKNHIQLDVSEYKNNVEFTFDNFIYEEKAEFTRIIYNAVGRENIVDDCYLAGNGRAIIVKF